MNLVDGMSMDIEKTEREKLKAVFPECFVEDKLDIDKLLNMCGEYITDDFERYEFKWKGKSECLQLAQRRSTGTLRPKPDESVNFANSQNLYIKGDNLEVLKILQTSYYRRVKMVILDPPYNTGNDFVYNDDFSDPIAHYKEVTRQAVRSNPETMGRFHTAWLNMMYPRLRLAATLLRDDGVCFISIDDNEVHNLRKICDEVFGEENFIAQIAVQLNPRGRHLERYVAKTHEYVVIYCKTYDNVGTMHGIPKDGKMIDEYNREDERGKHRLLGLRNRNQSFNPMTRPNLYYPLYVDPDTSRISTTKSDMFRDEVWPDTPDGTKTCWTWSVKKVDEENNLLTAEKTGNEWRIYRKDYLLSDDGESATTLIKSMWYDSEMNNDHGRKAVKELFGANVMDFPKPIELIKRAITTGATKDSIILDFFSGSATTAHAVMQLNAEDSGNRQFIMVQLPELTDEKSEAYKAGYINICEIGMDRIRRAGTKILAEWQEKRKQLSVGDEREESQSTSNPLDVGFKVFELDTSNLKTWDGTPIKHGQEQILLDRITNMGNRVKSDRTELDIVYEIILKTGFLLTHEIKFIEIQSKTAYVVDDYLLLIFLADDITPEVVTELCDLAPGTLIISKNSFADASAMANAHYICQDKQIEMKFV